MNLTTSIGRASYIPFRAAVLLYMADKVTRVHYGIFGAIEDRQCTITNFKYGSIMIITYWFYYLLSTPNTF